MLSAYAAGQWRRLAARCRHGQQTVILESTFLQNSVMRAFIEGAPPEAVREIFTTIEREAVVAEPLLIICGPPISRRRLRGSTASGGRHARLAEGMGSADHRRHLAGAGPAGRRAAQGVFVRAGDPLGWAGKPRGWMGARRASPREPRRGRRRRQ